MVKSLIVAAGPRNENLETAIDEECDIDTHRWL